MVAVVLLHRLARVDGLEGPGADPVGWLRTASPEEVVAGGLRLVALGCAWWLLASTVLYVAARASRVPAAMRVARFTVLPGIRARVDRALAVSVVGASVITAAAGAAPAGADEPSPTTTQPPIVIEQDHRPAPDEAVPVPDVRDGRVTDAVEELPEPSISPEPAPAPPSLASDRYVVAAGDNLWDIAAAHLGHDDEATVRAYWTLVVAQNQPALRSGDPDLIYPGEAIVLPPRE